MTDAEKMTALALSFPAIASKTGSPGIAPWDVLALVDTSACWSPSEKLIVAFLATVWDAGQDYTPPFNVIEAFQRWDARNFVAFQFWAARPFSC